jgi:hypothetical protein
MLLIGPFPLTFILINIQGSFTPRVSWTKYRLSSCFAYLTEDNTRFCTRVVNRLMTFSSFSSNCTSPLVAWRPRLLDRSLSETEFVSPSHFNEFSSISKQFLNGSSSLWGRNLWFLNAIRLSTIALLILIKRHVLLSLPNEQTKRIAKRSDSIECLLLPVSIVSFRWAMSVHCSFVLRHRVSLHQSAVAHSLLWARFINSASLGLLATGLIDLVVILTIFGSHSIVNELLNHLPIHLFTCATRLSSWLPLFVTLERVFISVFSSKQAFIKQAQMGLHEGVSDIWAHSFLCWLWTRLRWWMTHFAVCCVCWREIGTSVNGASVLRIGVPL